MSYSQERQDAVIKKMQAPDAPSIVLLSKQEGIPESTLYAWQAKYRKTGLLQPASSKEPSGWSSARKFSAVMATAAMDEVSMSAYCREQGIFPENIEQWKKACIMANDWDRAMNVEVKKSLTKANIENKLLTKELARKEKALAEAAAILVLQKKVNLLWELEEQ